MAGETEQEDERRAILDDVRAKITDCQTTIAAYEKWNSDRLALGLPGRDVGIETTKRSLFQLRLAEAHLSSLEPMTPTTPQ
jgi:hypothetical protein